MAICHKLYRTQSSYQINTKKRGRNFDKMRVNLDSITFYYIILLIPINVNIHNHLCYMQHNSLFGFAVSVDQVFSEVAVHQALLFTLVKAV